MRIRHLHCRFAAIVTAACLGTGGLLAEDHCVSLQSASDRLAVPTDSAIRAMLEKAVPSPQVHGAIVGLVDGGARRVVAYGTAGPGGPPIDSTNVFEIGSVSKAFIGVLLADMVRRGEVQLAQPVAQLLPRGVRVPSRAGREITLLDLATHTSGLPRMPDNVPRTTDPQVQAGYTIERLYEFLLTHELAREPGSQYVYSNLITLLGHALARHAARPYEALLRERVLLPVGMRETRVTLSPEMKRRMTTPANKAGEAQPYFVLPAFTASGGLKSTMNDMLTFAAANLTTDESEIGVALRDSRRPHRPLGDSGEFMGLGWAATPEGAAGLSGATYGYRAYLYVNPVRHRAIVVMTNAPEVDATRLGVSIRRASTPPW